jgi:DNA repair exonuclease SbcCD ATPase subunit
LKWFKDIFQRAKAEDKTSQVGLSYLDAWLEERGEDPKAQKRLSDIYTQIGQAAKDLSGDARALESSLPDEKAPPRLIKAGMGARGEIIRQIDSLTMLLSPPGKVDIESASEYHSSLVKGLGRTAINFGNAQRYVSALFPDDAGKINSDLNRLSRLLVELEGEIEKRQEETGGIRTARDLLARVRAEKAEVRNLSTSIKNDEDSLAELLRMRDGLEERLEGIASSEEGRSAEDLRRTVDLKREDLRQIEAQMSDLVAPLNKALARIMKQEESSRLCLQHREVFKKLTSSPQQAVDEDISSALHELRSNVDALGLRDKKREKILERIDHLIERKSLEDLKARYTEILQQINDLESRLEKTSFRSLELKKELDGFQSKIALLKANLAVEKNNLRALEEREALDEADLKMEIESLSSGTMEIDFEEGGEKS